MSELNLTVFVSEAMPESTVPVRYETASIEELMAILESLPTSSGNHLVEIAEPDGQQTWQVSINTEQGKRQVHIEWWLFSDAAKQAVSEIMWRYAAEVYVKPIDPAERAMCSAAVNQTHQPVLAQ